MKLSQGAESYYHHTDGQAGSCVVREKKRDAFFPQYGLPVRANSADDVVRHEGFLGYFFGLCQRPVETFGIFYKIIWHRGLAAKAWVTPKHFNRCKSTHNTLYSFIQQRPRLAFKVVPFCFVLFCFVFNIKRERE